MLTFKLVLVAATSVLGIALPEPTAPAQLNLRGVNCGKVNGAFGALEKLGPQGTLFCRSYVNMPATSMTVTITTPAIVTSTTSTTTVTVTSAQCPGQKRDLPGLQPGYEIKFFEEGSRVFQKRVIILPQLQAFGEAKISEACSCFDLKPTTTAVATSTAPAPITKVVATATACVVDKPAVCKVASSSFSSSCTSGSECCSGICTTLWTSGNCCNPSGGYCDLWDPAGCCSGWCISAQKGTNEGYCG